MTSSGDAEGLRACSGICAMSSSAADDLRSALDCESARVSTHMVAPSSGVITIAFTSASTAARHHSDAKRRLGAATRRLADAIDHAHGAGAAKDRAARAWEATDDRSNQLDTDYWHAKARGDEAAANHYAQEWNALQPTLTDQANALAHAQVQAGEAEEGLRRELSRFKTLCRREADKLHESLAAVYKLADHLVPPKVARVVGNPAAISTAWTPSLSDPGDRWKKGKVKWSAGGPILDPGGAMNPTDVSQGDVGDCYFLAALIVAGKLDPNFYKDHFHDNGNGTVTVTLYVRGKPVKVTVTDKVPTKGGADQGATGTNGDWPALYEKAFAALDGSYGAISGGSCASGLSVVTGRPVSSATPSHLTFGKLSALVHGGKAVTISTGNTGDGTSDRHGTLIEAHCYVVEAVHPNGTVTLRNPWDSSDHPTLSWSQIQRQTDQISWCSA